MDRHSRVVRVSDVERALAHAFPPERAEEWDRVGLLAGDPDAVVSGVLLGLDPSREAIHDAVATGANVLVTHHPAFLTSPISVRPGSGGVGVLFDALTHGVALVCAHTNLDRDRRAQEIAARLLGLEPLRALERATQPRAFVTVYVPQEAAFAVTDAMVTAGAGRIGDYVGCSFSAPGVGVFTPAAESSPCTGTPGQRSSADELRVEVVCPRNLVGTVVAAAAAAHPYEEPLVTAADIVVTPNANALGMVCRVSGASVTLAELAATAASAFGSRPRVWGEPGRRVGTVATATGSAGSLVPAAAASGADVLVAGEVRYHDALDALDRGLCVIEVGHDASEWPLVELLEKAVVAGSGVDPALVKRRPPTVRWWVAGQ